MVCWSCVGGVSGAVVVDIVMAVSDILLGASLLVFSLVRYNAHCCLPSFGLWPVVSSADGVRQLGQLRQLRHLRVILHHHAILHNGHHPPWLGISSAITPGVLCTPSVLAGKQSTKVNQPSACGLFLLYPARCLRVGPLCSGRKAVHKW